MAGVEEKDEGEDEDVYEALVHNDCHAHGAKHITKLELGIYIQWVKDEINKEKACLELPFTLVLLFSFTFLALRHLRQDQVYVVETALKHDINENANFAFSHYFGHKSLNDVNSYADFYSWLRLGYLPLMVQQSWAYSEGLQEAYIAANTSHPFQVMNLPTHYRFDERDQPLPVRNDLLHYNRIVGGIRLQQERTQASFQDCRIPTSVPEFLWRPWFGKACYPAYRNYNLKPDAEDAESFGKPARVEWMLSAMDSLENLVQMAVDMEDGCSHLGEKGREGACLCSSCSEDGTMGPWLDEATQRVEAGFVSYNPQYGLLSMVTVSFLFRRGGSIQKLVHVQSSWANQWGGTFSEILGVIAFDLVWLLCLGWVFVGETGEIIKVIRASKERWYRSIYADYIGFWNTVDWVSIGCAILMIVMCIRLYLTTDDALEMFKHLVELDHSLTVDRQVYQQSLQQFIQATESMCASERLYRMSFCLYPMIVLLRLFKSFHAQPRLAVVTRTLQQSGQDMLHFFIVFFSIYFCMVVNGVLLFGQDNEEFATFFRSVFMCFRAMFGEFDWNEMKKTERILAGIWFWVFVSIVVIVLLNMLLSILIDAYTEIKSKAEAQMSLPMQVSEIIRRRRQFLRKERVRLNDIYDGFFKMFGDEKDMISCTDVITADDIVLQVPGIPKKQAERTLKNAKQAHDKLSEEPYCLEIVHRSLIDMEKITHVITEQVKGLRKVFTWYLETDELPVLGMVAREQAVSSEQQVVDAVREGMDGLGSHIAGRVSSRLQSLSQRQKLLEVHQRDLLLSVKDSLQGMKQVRVETDQIVDILRQQLELQRRMAPRMSRQGAALASAPFSFKACSYR